MKCLFFNKNIVFATILLQLNFWAYGNQNINSDQNNYSHSDSLKSSSILTSQTIYNFGDVYINKISNVQFYYVSASNLTSDLVITAPNQFKISIECYENFTNSLSITPSSGNIPETRIYVRFFPSSTGNFSGNVTNSSSGSTSRNVSVGGKGVTSQIPSGYYSSATGSNEELMTQLHNIIRNHTRVAYSSIWNHFENTDKKYNGKVWDIYADIQCDAPPYEYTFFDDQQGADPVPDEEGHVYNREHSWPRSWWGGGISSTDTINTDLFHIYPSDRWVNAVRGSWPFSTVNSPSWTSLNGGKLGNNSYSSNYSSTAFEPIDEYKGDFARTYFYVVTRYMHNIPDWSSNQNVNILLDGSNYPAFEPWYIEMLLEWHSNDPVSQKEIDRNNAIYTIQGNRNPFIDHPEFVNQIWGTPDEEVIVNSIAELRQQNTDNTTIYNLTSEAILTFQYDYRNKKYIQDPNGQAAIEIDDNDGIITTQYNLYDGITGIKGTLNVRNNFLQFIPIEDPGPVTSYENNIEPEIKTLNNINSNDQAKLINVHNVSFNNTGNFANGNNYNITDPTSELVFRTNFYDVDYIGQPIPEEEINLTAIVIQHNQTLQITPRFLNDFEIVEDENNGDDDNGDDDNGNDDDNGDDDNGDDDNGPTLFTLTLVTNLENAGSVSGGGDYQEAASVTVSTNANAGFLFYNWTRNEEVINTNKEFSYIMPSEDVTLTANYKKTLAIDGLIISNKIYDGNDYADIQAFGELIGILGDNHDVAINQNYYSASFNNKNAGIDKPVNIVGLTLSGSDAHKYYLDPEYNTTATIYKKELLVINAMAENKTYDKTTNAIINNAELYGLIENDDVFLFNHTSGHFSQKEAGSDVEVYTSMNINGSDKDNYLIEQPDYLFANILQLELSIGGAFAVADKEYDGTSDAVIDEDRLTLVGIIDGDQVFLANVVVEFVQEESGEDIEVIIISADIEGDDADNYTLSLDGAPTTTANIIEVEPDLFSLELITEPTGAGNVSGAGDYPEGYEVMVTASENSGFKFLKWVDENDNEISNKKEYRFSMPDNDLTLKALFEELTNILNQDITGVNIYPNPTSGILNIESEEIIIEIKIINMPGKVVYSYTPKEKNLQVFLNNLNPGIYFVKVYTQTGIKTMKLFSVD